MVMPPPKSSSLRRTKKNRFAVGAKVLVIMPGVTGVVTHVDDEPGIFGEYMHAIKTEHGQRHEPGSNLELVPKAETNAESAPSAPPGSTHIHIENMENSAFIQGSPGASVNQTFDIHSQEFSHFVA
jgi:hypothetical protein